ncbi:NAD(P)-binding protein [Hymenopellis radicata]|nr:NAD(P)-binding protein [Hymenopellis radicata]
MSQNRRTAIITRSTQGIIGRSCALRLAEDGCNIAISDVASEQSRLSQLQREIESKGVQCRSYLADPSREEDIKRLINSVVQDLGGVDIMVANVAVAPTIAPIAETSIQDFDNSIAMNARSMFLILKYTGQQMIRQGRGGRIIGGAGSSSWRVGLLPNMAAQNASSFAVRGLMQTAALELGKDNITVNAYSNGLLESDKLNESALQRLSNQPNLKTGGIQELVASRTPLPKKAAVGQDIARVVSMLASNDCDFMTGQTVQPSLRSGVALTK